MLSFQLQVCLCVHFCEFVIAYSCSVILSSTERYIFSFKQVKCYRRRRVNIFIAGFLVESWYEFSKDGHQSKWNLAWRNSAIDISVILIVNVTKCCAVVDKLLDISSLSLLSIKYIIVIV